MQDSNFFIEDDDGDFPDNEEQKYEEDFDKV